LQVAQMFLEACPNTADRAFRPVQLPADFQGRVTLQAQLQNRPLTGIDGAEHMRDGLR
jgi:hypothetical protein